MAREDDSKYLIKTVQQSLAVEDLLAKEFLLEWRTLQEIARGSKLSTDCTYRILKTLSAHGRVEESDKGWRISPDGLIRYAFQVQAYFNEQANRFMKPS